MRFTIAPYCAAISPAACVPAMPSACTVLSASSFKPRAARVELQAARPPRARRENAERRARVPALADVLGPHAQSHARADLVAGDGGRQELAAAHAAELSDGHERRQHHRAPV